MSPTSKLSCHSWISDCPIVCRSACSPEFVETSSPGTELDEADQASGKIRNLEAFSNGNRNPSSFSFATLFQRSGKVEPVCAQFAAARAEV
jgi:hypothetical protein